MKIKKYLVMDPLSIGLAAGGFLINAFGQQKAAKAMREAEAQNNQQIADLTAWRDTEVNRPYLDSNVGRNVMTRAMEKFGDQALAAKSTAAVTGASDEAVIAQQTASQGALGDVMSNVAAQGTVREDQIQNQYKSNLANLLAQKMGLIQGRAQSGANLATSAGSFLSGMGGLLTSDKVKDPLAGLDVFGRTSGANQALGTIAGSAKTS